ncbi:MAG: Bax inhibitor-1/YccA family protein [Spirochaetales bacterium]|nr:Bax inhibitor-1/YccA family protein [Spirochaetales bacterium]
MEQRTASIGLDAIKIRGLLRNVYLWMTAGLAITGLVSMIVIKNQKFLITLYQTPYLLIGLLIGELILVGFLSVRIMKMSIPAATITFALYSAINGVTIAPIVFLYTSASVATTFFITAGTFAGMSIYAMLTKRDLTGIGNYLFMGLIGVIIASVVNFFLHSEVLYWIISLVGVVVFVGLTAYDTQKIIKWQEQLDSQQSGDELVFTRLSILGALHLYLDFINLFLLLLRLFGRRR